MFTNGRPIVKLKLLLSCAVALGPLFVNAQTIVSEFTHGPDQWKVRDYFTGEGGATSDWYAGALQTTDVRDHTVFSAPSPLYTGNKLGFYGGTVTFDLYSTYLSADTAGSFVLAIGSGSTMLHWFAGQPSNVDFQTFTAVLNPQAGGWEIGGGPNGGGSTPSATQFMAVLANVTHIYVNADWNDGDDYVQMDNFAINAVPEPASWLLLSGSIGLLGLIARKRRAVAGHSSRSRSRNGSQRGCATT